MTHFHKIIIEGFGSIQKRLIYNLDSPGMNILTARNGTGKTTIFSALYWVLFGKTLKKSNLVQTWEKLRLPGFKGTKVSTNFNKGSNHYEVIRYEKYKGHKSRLVLIENGKERNDLRDKKDVQKEICDILGMSLDLFKNSIIFGQKMKRLIEEDGPTKKKVFEEIFETQYIQNAKVVAEENKTILSQDLQACYSDNNLIEAKLQSARAHRKNLKEIIAEFEDRKKEELEDLQEAHENTLESISDREEELREIKDAPNTLMKLENRLNIHNRDKDTKKDLEGKLFKVDFTLSQIEGANKDILYTQKYIKQQLAIKTNTCSMCKQKIPKAQMAKERKNFKRQLKEIEINKEANRLKEVDLKAEKKLILEQLVKYETIHDKINATNIEIALASKQVAKYKEKTYAIKTLKEFILPILKRIETCRNKKAPKNNQLKVINKLKKDLEKSQTLTLKVKKQWEIQDWLIKDPLSNSGIKAYIFNHMLGLVNQKLKKYGHFLNMDITFGMDLASAHKDFYITIQKYNSIIHYEDLSGGEAQLVNICIAFAIHDVVSNEKPFNILIMDEIFEGCDAENIDIISDLIKLKSQGRSIHIITHHKDFIPTNANFIRLFNKGGLTYKAA